MRLPLEVLVDGRGRSAALGDRPDDERLAAAGVAGDEDARRGWSGSRLALDVAARRRRRRGSCVGDQLAAPAR